MRGRKRIRKKHLQQAGWTVLDEDRPATRFFFKRPEHGEEMHRDQPTRPEVNRLQQRGWRIADVRRVPGQEHHLKVRAPSGEEAVLKAGSRPKLYARAERALLQRS